VPESMKGPWHNERPELLDEIRADLRENQPSLHLFLEEGREPEVRGTFVVRSPSGRELERFLVSIELPANYPKNLPIVRETGGRIPWKADDYHIESDGKACVMFPDDRWRVFPEGAPFRDFLNGPLHDFFFGQSFVALGQKWPFGEWGHGAKGVRAYYRELLGVVDDGAVITFLRFLAKLNMKPHWLCPCGRGRKVRQCCAARLADLRKKIPPAAARKSLEHLGARLQPLERDEGNEGVDSGEMCA
jgi:hypothetical protein